VLLLGTVEVTYEFLIYGGSGLVEVVVGADLTNHLGRVVVSGHSGVAKGSSHRWSSQGVSSHRLSYHVGGAHHGTGRRSSRVRMAMDEAAKGGAVMW